MRIAAFVGIIFLKRFDVLGVPVWGDKGNDERKVFGTIVVGCRRGNRGGCIKHWRAW